MSQLQDIQSTLAKAQEQLTQLVEEEQQQQAEDRGQAPFWSFVYEQLLDDGEWHPNQQTIQAYDIARAFRALGFVIQKLNLSVRNIRYGLHCEMHDENERVRQYWRNLSENKKGQNV